MTGRHRICLVTAELYPFTRGGIGRLLHNQIQDALGRDAPVEIHLLFPHDVGITQEQLDAHFDRRVRGHWASSTGATEATHRPEGSYPPPAALTATPCHAESLQLMLRLWQLSDDGVDFAVIEFPDYKGWAFCSLQEKRLGGAFRDSEVAIQLHSSAGIIAHFTRRKPSLESVALFELERKALRDADRIVAHLPGVPTFNRRFYGFPAEWEARVSIEFPAVTHGPHSGVPTVKPPPARTRDLVFAAKVERFKRPDLFVRGAVLLMRKRPDFSGKAVLACHAPEPHMVEEVRRLIPADLTDRFVFISDSPAEREKLIAEGIVAITSDYESVCLLAYEVSEAGGALVLNGQCVAFGEDTPFADPENCFKFDGTVDGLARAFGRALDEPQPRVVLAKRDAPYWETVAVRSTPRRKARLEPPLVSVVITNFNLGRYLPEAVESAAASDHPNLELIVVDDASTDPLDREMLSALESQSAGPRGALTVVRNMVNRGLGASRNIGIEACRGEYILPLDADDRISPTFVSQAVAALEASHDHDVVVPSTAFFLTDEDLEERRFSDYATFLGDAPTLGLVTNRFGCATSLLRRSLFERFKYNELLTSYEDWDLYLRLALAGHRFLVTNQLHFFYRFRERSMIRGVTPERHAELLAQIYERLPASFVEPVHLAVFLGLALPTSLEPGAVAEKPLRHVMLDSLHQKLDRVGMGSGARLVLSYELADAVNRRVKKLPRMHGLLKRTTGRSPTR